MKKTSILLGIILLIAACIRLYQLGNVPASPDWDEVSLGYNAYSVLTTGKDEYGEYLPVVMRSFDDYKPALYAYLIIPLIPIFDLSIISVRLPGAIAGILAVLGTYVLAKELFSTLSIGKKNIATFLSLLAAFLMAISPWHIQFSRIAFETQVGMCMNIYAFYFFLKGIQNPMFLPLSFALAAANIHMYQSNRVFSPLLVIALTLIYIKPLLNVKKWLVASIIVAFIISLPFVYYTVTNKNALLRAQGVSIFSNQSIIARSSERLAEDSASNNKLGMVLNNRRGEFIKMVVAGYISHYDLNWLFMSGDIARHHAPFMGLMYLVELPFLFIGLYILLFYPYDTKKKIAFFVYLLLVPIPASITSGVPHAVRTLNFVPLVVMLTATGMVWAYYAVSAFNYRLLNIKIKYVLFFIFISICLLNIAYYLNQYFVQQNYYTSKEWQYGYKDAVAEVKRIENKYDKIIVSNKPHLDQSYMFFLFYLKYDPLTYQKEAQYSSGGFRENHMFGKYEFRPIEWEKEEKSSSILYVGRPQDFPESQGYIKKVNFVDGEGSIVIVEGS